MNSRKLLAIIATAGSLAGLVACAGVDEPAETVSGTPEPSTSSSAGPSRPTLTASRLQPPPLDNEYTADDRPEVVFDPCTWMSDAAVRKAGLDPASRRRGQDIVAEYSFLTCDFDGELRGLSVNSGNVSWEEDLQKNGAHSEPLTVNGREALLVKYPDMDDVCSVHVRSKAGIVMFSSTRTFEGVEAGLQLCDGVVEIATALEPEIGAEN
ncbi:DUF3558 domain-containing protein [Nocardia carnea]|uniref:DUF3558 domain-containing protein n=1 Tax=Nocardia carnea TaxID=37328 RepID=A0ABW7TQ75_9NOCA|nr:DUF3558 domain-containing protein [Nocardia carnea]